MPELKDCQTCYHRAMKECIYGLPASPDCSRYQRQYKCAGGLVHDHKLTPEECHECARTCKGCLEMAVAYGFLDEESVRHLLQKAKLDWEVSTS